MQVRNPILRGFHPDPSILRVGSEYYLAVSTFEWFPGVRIYHSGDLAHWEFYSAPLDDYGKLELRGVSSSDGVWAPCLSYDGEYFYLIYTITHSAREFPVMDTPNYLIRAKQLKGPWSVPVYLNSSGFDPSLFHDRDGRKYLLNMEWDYRGGVSKSPFAGILLQEYDPEKEELLGKPEKIFLGSGIGLTEGPHLYWHEGYYYLICAEGGTGWFHAVTVARSRNIHGSYELCPDNPVLSSWEGSREAEEGQMELREKELGNGRIQKAGHASILHTEDGSWYMAHLCARRIPGLLCCTIGRETGLQEVEWRNGWPVLKRGGRLPGNFVEVPGKRDEIYDPFEGRTEYCFDNEDFRRDFQTLRISFEDAGMTVKERRGWLRIYGKESIYSRFYQALIARRQTELSFKAGICFQFQPESYQHSAGLIYRYDEKNQFYAFVTFDEEYEGCAVCLVSVQKGKTSLLYKAPVSEEEFELEIAVENDQAWFYYMNQGERTEMGKNVCIRNLSDDYANGFTGCFVGMCVQDLQNQKKYADFERFWYEGLPEEND